jgi:hypothetical protein
MKAGNIKILRQLDLTRENLIFITTGKYPALIKERRMIS